MGLAAGAASGIVGSWVMTQFHVSMYGRGVTGTREPQSHRPVEGDDDAATLTADAVAQTATGRSLGEAGKRIGGPLVHYAFGTSVGMIYGAALARALTLRHGYGVAFGLLVWIVADEALLPVLGLARGPRAYPAAVHLEMLAAHVVFGIVTHSMLVAMLASPEERPPCS
jgi:uncharacterized membrane protein YagU involved in acid resistance